MCTEDNEKGISIQAAPSSFGVRPAKACCTIHHLSDCLSLWEMHKSVVAIAVSLSCVSQCIKDGANTLPGRASMDFLNKVLSETDHIIEELQPVCLETNP